MASTIDIATVRQNTDEPTDADYSDTVIGGLVDADGVDGASATIWTWKAAKFAKLVNTTEAGASHSNSDLSKNALAMAKKFETVEAVVEAPSDATRVRAIVRE